MSLQGERYPTQNFADRDGGLVEASKSRRPAGCTVIRRPNSQGSFHA
jgi:hypothetical protein